jgi:hypothetical protein
MKKTAVDYLFEKLWGIPKDKFTWQMILNEAKKKEKRQIIEAYLSGEHQQGFEGEAEQYYNETYGDK